MMDISVRKLYNVNVAEKVVNAYRVEVESEEDLLSAKLDPIRLFEQFNPELSYPCLEVLETDEFLNYEFSGLHIEASKSGLDFYVRARNDLRGIEVRMAVAGNKDAAVDRIHYGYGKLFVRDDLTDASNRLVDNGIVFSLCNENECVSVVLEERDDVYVATLYDVHEIAVASMILPKQQ